MMRGFSIFLDDTAPAEASARGVKPKQEKASTPRERERLAILRRLQAGSIDANTAADLLDQVERTYAA